MNELCNSTIQSVDDMALATIRVKPFKWYRLS